MRYGPGFTWESHNLEALVAAAPYREQLRPKAQDPQRPYALRVRLQTMDNRTRTIQTEPAPANAGTKHLVFRLCPIEEILPMAHA